MVSIVMPAYNESEIIAATVAGWTEIARRIPGAEVIVVDDCSKDDTYAVLRGMSERIPEMKAARTPGNLGHGGALRYGFALAEREYVFQTDSDGQHVPEEFWKLWERRGEAEFVFGKRLTRADGAVRKLITRGMRLINYLLWGCWIEDANCPFKLMRREALEGVLEQVPRNSFIPMVMVAILARREGYRVVDVGVTHLPRRGGEQSLKGLWKWIRVAWRCTGQLIALRRGMMRGRGRKPAKNRAVRGEAR